MSGNARLNQSLFKSNKMRQRNRMDLWTPAELAIYNAMREVEKMPASVTLTNAVIKLSEAQNLVADYLDESLDSTPINQADEDVRDYEASDKAVIEHPCDAPLKDGATIEQLGKESLSALGFVFEKIGHNDFNLLGVFHDEYGIEINWYDDNTFGFPYGSEGNVMELKSINQLIALRNLLTNKND
jgi:hypothetical protein